MLQTFCSKSCPGSSFATLIKANRLPGKKATAPDAKSRKIFSERPHLADDPQGAPARGRCLKHLVSPQGGRRARSRESFHPESRLYDFAWLCAPQGGRRARAR